MKRGVGFYVGVIHNQMDRKVNRYLREIGLTQPQANILHFLNVAKKRGDKVKQRDIEEYFHISNPTVSGLLTRLEQKDFIVRTQNEKDKRIHFIEPSKKAEELEDTMKELFKRFNAEILEGIDPQLVDNGMEFLDLILKNLGSNWEGEKRFDD